MTTSTETHYGAVYLREAISIDPGGKRLMLSHDVTRRSWAGQRVFNQLVSATSDTNGSQMPLQKTGFQMLLADPMSTLFEANRGLFLSSQSDGSLKNLLSSDHQVSPYPLHPYGPSPLHPYGPL